MNGKSRAFTAVELLAATALASLLMVAVMMVIASIGRASVDHQEQSSPWLPRAAELIRQDLVDGKNLEIKGQILIQGYGEIDPMTLVRTQRPAEVRYFVQKAGTRSVLVRQQRTFDEASGIHVFTQILALDIASITLTDLQEHKHVRLTIQGTGLQTPGVNTLLILE